jgi:hypothetical protein
MLVLAWRMHERAKNWSIGNAYVFLFPGPKGRQAEVTDRQGAPTELVLYLSELSYSPMELH